MPQNEKFPDLESNRPIVHTMIHPVTWKLMIVIGVFLYSSYTILVHMTEVDGHIPFSATSMNFLIELTKLLTCLVLLQRSRLGLRAVQHLGWMCLFSNAWRYYALPACLYGITANLCVHLQIEMDPVTYQICICGISLGPALYQGIRVSPSPTVPLVAPFAVPALLYFINNNVSVFMQLEMDPASFQVLSNFKIPTTALLYRIIMKRSLSRSQWLALLLLLIAGISSSYGGIHNSTLNKDRMYVTPKGLVMMLCFCTLSSLSGVYSEYIFKNKYEMSIHVQNGLMYIFGSIFNLCTWVYTTNINGDSWNPLAGYTWHTWILIISQACSGLIMGAIMKHGSNLTRLFLISSSMVLTTAMSVLIFGLQLNIYYSLAFVLVSVALALYHDVLSC